VGRGHKLLTYQYALEVTNKGLFTSRTTKLSHVRWPFCQGPTCMVKFLKNATALLVNKLLRPRLRDNYQVHPPTYKMLCWDTRTKQLQEMLHIQCTPLSDVLIWYASSENRLLFVKFFWEFVILLKNLSKIEESV
jgi:hypothetical protein